MAGLATTWRSVGSWVGGRRAELRLAARVTAAGVAAFALTTALGMPQGYWAVFTAVIVTQASLGGSLKVAIDQLTGAMSGGAIGAAVATLIPHTEPGMLGLALAAALAPLAIMSALHPAFRVAPITAMIVLMGSFSQHASPIESALDRVVDIALGGSVGVVISLFFLPARAHGVLTTTAGNALGLLAQALPILLGGLTARPDPAAIQKLLDRIRSAIGRLEVATDEARRERRTHLTDEPDPEPFLRTLLRLRHDLVMMNRAAATPLPDPLRSRLAPALATVSGAAAAFLNETGVALGARRLPPASDTMDAAFDAFAAQIVTLRGEGLIRAMPVDDVARLYAFSFALEQLHRNFRDIASRTTESARQAAMPLAKPAA
jgi:uncharacterized membrane protein YccC